MSNGFIKLGELIDLVPTDVQSRDSVLISDEIIQDFKKTAAQLKRIAPRADDFLYFSAVMMHAAEASLVNDDGTPKLSARGEAVKANWDKTGGSWRWICSDNNIKPYRNSNGDIFPEEELVKAYKKWVGKPLCIDHKSSSVDHVRGFIVDTYYDRNLKRVIALCALDKHNYPELARKVATGYSNSVSMGTAVGRAICSDCATVARTEADFCQHMRAKSCYGEINVDLNPIELSIVVNGADPQAKIKHIIASAQRISNYFDEKEQELKKIASQFSASLNLENPEKSGTINVKSADLETFKADIQKAIDELGSLDSTANAENLTQDTNDSAFNQSGSSVAMAETETESTDLSLAPPVQRFASESEFLTELSLIKSAIESKFEQMQQDLDKLANQLNTTQEEIMSGSKENMNKKGYFQGGGEGNEPTPGQTKYTKDPLNEQLRENGDKQMATHETGPVDGMFPGDLEKKKMLARAEAEDRRMRREAIVSKAKEAVAADKKAYFLGGSEGNEPTPGKKKYPVDPMNEKLREDGDKHMEGQKPFPDVGAVDGLHPSPASADQKDELKRKEMLARASYKARFVKGATPAASAWQVFAGEQLVLTASVEEIAGDKAEVLYSGIATKEYGQDLINKVKALGADKAKALFKSAQPAPAAMPEAAPAPTAEPAAPAAEDTGAEGDPKDVALELADKAKDVTSDLAEAVRALTGEQAEMGDAAPMEMAAAEDGKVSTAQLQGMRKELNGALISALNEATATLADHENELRTIASLYGEGKVTEKNEDLVASVLESAAAETKEAMADSLKLLSAFVKYARGTQAIVKRAEEEAELNTVTETGEQQMTVASDETLMDMIADTDAELAQLNDADAGSEMLEADANAAVSVPDAQTAAEVAQKNPNVEVKVEKAAFDLSSKEGRSALRAKLASEMKWNPMLYEFHPKGNATVSNLDTKPEGNFAVVETIEETHDAMMDLAKAGPKVRKEAEAIQQLVSEGKLDPKDFPALIANGLDGEAVSYWKKYFGEVEGGSEFAGELVKEHAKAQLEQEMSTYRVKLARAYELTYDLVERGLVAQEKSAINDHVDQVMKWNDEAFESYKKVLAKQLPAAMRKEASGRMPQVGLLGNGEVVVESAQDLTSLLTQALSTSKKRSF